MGEPEHDEEDMDPTEPPWHIGHRIHKARLNAGLDQTDLAQACRVSRATVSKWERGLSDPRSEEIRAVAERCEAPWLMNLRFRIGSYLRLVSSNDGPVEPSLGFPKAELVCVS